jgi:hypothetical protein
MLCSNEMIDDIHGPGLIISQNIIRINERKPACVEVTRLAVALESLVSPHAPTTRTSLTML